LRTLWLVAACRLEEAADEQSTALDQAEAAIEASRLPAADMEWYAVRIPEELRLAQERCSP
jgi:hypothetical protein